MDPSRDDCDDDSARLAKLLQTDLLPGKNFTYIDHINWMSLETCPQQRTRKFKEVFWINSLIRQDEWELRTVLQRLIGSQDTNNSCIYAEEGRRPEPGFFPACSCKRCTPANKRARIKFRHPLRPALAICAILKRNWAYLYALLRFEMVSKDSCTLRIFAFILRKYVSGLFQLNM